LNQAVFDPTVQEPQTFVKMADICCYGVQYGKCEWGVRCSKKTTSCHLQ